MRKVDFNDKNCKEILKEHFSDERMRDNMSDEELLALLLSFTSAKGRLDTVMKGLYDNFGSFRRCFLADYSDIMRVEGMTHHGAMLILLAGKLASVKEEKYCVGRKVDDFCDLFLHTMKPSRKEEFWAAVLDAEDRLVAVEMLSSGVQGKISVPLADILLFATYHNSRKLIVAHSHPDLFEAKASSHDMRAMVTIGSSVGAIGVKLYGQVIVAGKNARFYPYDPKPME